MAADQCKLCGGVDELQDSLPAMDKAALRKEDSLHGATILSCPECGRWWERRYDRAEEADVWIPLAHEALSAARTVSPPAQYLDALRRYRGERNEFLLREADERILAMDREEISPCWQSLLRWIAELDAQQLPKSRVIDLLQNILARLDQEYEKLKNTSADYVFISAPNLEPLRKMITAAHGRTGDDAEPALRAYDHLTHLSFIYAKFNDPKENSPLRLSFQGDDGILISRMKGWARGAPSEGVPALPDRQPSVATVNAASEATASVYYAPPTTLLRKGMAILTLIVGGLIAVTIAMIPMVFIVDTGERYYAIAVALGLWLALMGVGILAERIMQSWFKLRELLIISIGFAILLIVGSHYANYRFMLWNVAETVLSTPDLHELRTLPAAEQLKRYVELKSGSRNWTAFGAYLEYRADVGYIGRYGPARMRRVREVSGGEMWLTWQLQIIEVLAVMIVLTVWVARLGRKR